jgi:hypothetical protein
MLIFTVVYFFRLGNFDIFKNLGGGEDDNLPPLLSAPVAIVNEFFDSNRISWSLVEVISKNIESSIQPVP